ncbi:2-methylbutyryl-CoA dehydrogenase, putative [Eimeria necatrix]|uniref:2-methylbutyryl-CoA dehydrogenase, putative n=1 Tax=Eimeria necatrix TaxID=51315 RepID=U6N2N2_9EIME|nr:2-methylbutyryl-CoA dehydrogenase, putative [Eimeria necatrix]CDJ68195.1 2-methylbutyryl-CoA dehydrogenase, putative [Eimeria necatrix]
MGVNSEDGGSGISFLDSLLVVKEMSRVDPAVGLMVTVHNHLVLGALNRFGTSEQKDKFLPILSSDTVGCFCLGEDHSNSGSSSSLFDLKCTATRDAEKGGWVINGKKRYVLNAKESGLFLVVAVTGADEAEGQLTCFLVEREGIKIETETAKAGSQASSVSEVSLKGTFVPDSHVLGPVGGAKKICDELLMDSQIGVAAQQLGLAEGALHVALPYLIERRKIDEDAKSSYIKYEVAKAAAEIESVKALVYYAASLRTAAAPAAAAAAAAARYKAAATAAAVSSKCVDLVGPSALSKDLEKYYRDSKSTAYDLCGEEQLLQPIFEALINEYS